MTCADEHTRLRRLVELDVVATFPDNAVRRITETLRSVMQVPVAFVSIIGESDQWTKAACGELDVAESIPRGISFCTHTIASDVPLVVEDATTDERFARNPLVQAAPHIRFYAGFPIMMDNGFPMGALCVTDTIPRKLSPEQLRLLENLAFVVSDLVQQKWLSQARADLSARLLKQKELLDFASSVAKLGAWETDIQSGALLWSDGMYAIHEMDPGVSVSADQLMSFYHPEDRIRVRDLIAQVRAEGTSYDFEARMIGSKGTEKIVRVLSQTEYEDGKAIRRFGIKQDVTERVNASLALRESLDHYRHIVELSPQVPWTADQNGNVLEAGPRWTELTGMTIKESLGGGWAEALHPEDLERVSGAWKYCIDTGNNLDVEYRLRTRDGSFRWVRGFAAPRHDMDGAVIKWYGSVEDINDRRLAETKLQESEGFLRSILDSSLDCIRVLDIEGRVLYMNEPGIHLNEISDIALVVGKHWAELWPQQASAIALALDEARLGRTGRLAGVSEGPSGVQRHWDCFVTPIRGADGKPERLLSVSRDISATKHVEHQAVEAFETLQNVLEATGEAVMVLGQDWTVKFLNGNASGLEGQGGVLVKGRKLWEVYPEYVGSEFDKCYRQALESQQAVSFEALLNDGETWLGVRAYPAGETLSVFYRDVTEEKAARDRIDYLAHHDTLTGLPNRLSFNLALEAAQTSNRRFAVLLLDLDAFKEINDTLGHLVGDKLLQRVADRLKDGCLDGDFVARFGGDEFAFVLFLNDEGEVIDRAAAIVEQLDQPFTVDGHDIRSLGSIGVACSGAGRDSVALLQMADISLYRAKHDGGNRYCLFEPEMQAKLVRHQVLKQELKFAIERSEIQLHYQPLFRASDNQLQGFEALMRWHRPSGAVSPAEFIPLAEQTGLISNLGQWALQEACQQAINWPKEVYVSVNVSPAQFKSQLLPLMVAKVLCDTGLEACRLELEITESVLLNDSEANIEMLHALKALGVKIALDDFGTGFSSLSYLRRFPFDRIKIDKSFVSEIGSSAHSESIIKTIVMLGHSLGMSVTSEGIETREQLEWLREAGTDVGQGYYLGRPAPSSEITTSLRRWKV